MPLFSSVDAALSLYSPPEVAPSPVVLHGFGQACKWQMDNGRPRRSCLTHVLFMRRGVFEGAAALRDAPGHTWRQKHTLPTAAQPLSALRLRNIHRGLCKKKKSGIICFYMQFAVEKKAILWIADHEDVTVC